jgi:molybdate transport system substrate-binding protein
VNRHRRAWLHTCLCAHLAALGATIAWPVVAADAPLIAAASDLRFALDDVAARFARDHGAGVRIVYGSSGNFRRQIAEGAPFELFLSADDAYVLALAKEGRTADEGVLYATGRIALVVPEGSALRLEPQLTDLAAAVADGRVRKFAIANPEHAPYGRAAQEALSAAGAWEAIRPRLVLGENVAQAAQFALSASAQGGIVALSLALAPEVLGSGRYVAIPATMHRPLNQRMVLTRQARSTARAFYAYLQQPAARAVFVRYGFALPGE